MRIRLVMLVGGLLLLTSSIFASPCLNTTTVSALAGLSSTGCDVVFGDETVTFSNFAATGSASGAMAVLNTNLAVGGNALMGLAGFTFTDPGTNFSTGFTLSFTATIKPGSCATGNTCALTGVVEQSLITPSNSTGSITLLESAGSPNPLTVTNQTDNLFASINVPTLSKTATYNGAGTLISFESDIFNTATAVSAVPEPLSLSLVGTGLLALGVLRRKRTIKDS